MNISNKGCSDNIKADFETDPILNGKTDSDDAAFYFNKESPSESEILAVSKCDDSPYCGGLYVHDLRGRTKQILNVGKLNNVDSSFIKGEAYAYASNREDTGVSIFKRNKEGSWIHLGSHKALDDAKKSYEPYGICAAKNKIAVSSKLGFVYIYEYKNDKLELVDTINLDKASQPYDSFIKDVTLKSVTKKNKLYKLDKYMKQRFVSEGCVFDKRTGDLYISEEKLGIWKYSRGELQLMKKIEGSYAEESNRTFTDDLEGMDIYYRGEKAYLSVSSQGPVSYTHLTLPTILLV